MNELLSIIYVSSATTLMSDAALEELLIQARRKNGALSVTGLLLYSDGNFMQLIEGPGDNVAALYGSIRRDARHHSVLTISEELVQEREFDGWSMAYKKVDEPIWMTEKEKHHAGGKSASPSISRQILRSFWKRWQS